MKNEKEIKERIEKMRLYINKHVTGVDVIAATSYKDALEWVLEN